MNHYVYILSFIDGKKYVGVHSTVNRPEDDICYLGSGIDLPKRTIHSCTKVILATYATREEATKAEEDYILAFNCVNSDQYYNKRIHNYDKFGKHSIDVCAGTASMAQKLKGRSKESHSYIEKVAEKLKKYKGFARTPAQLNADKTKGFKTRGIKDPRKGKPGTSNNGFSPWYYITPEGDYNEVHHMTKQEFAPTIGVTPRQLGHRFHHTNMHKVAKSKPLRGWTFGDLPRVTDSDTE